MSAEELYQNGGLKDLLKKGWITPTTYRSVEIFLEVKNQELAGKKRTHAVKIVASSLRGKQKPQSKLLTVWRAIKCVEGSKNKK